MAAPSLLHSSGVNRYAGAATSPLQCSAFEFVIPQQPGKVFRASGTKRTACCRRDPEDKRGRAFQTGSRASLADPRSKCPALDPRCMPGVHFRGTVEQEVDRSAVRLTCRLSVDRNGRHEQRAIAEIGETPLIIHAWPSEEQVVEALRTLNVVRANHHATEHLFLSVERRLATRPGSKSQDCATFVISRFRGPLACRRFAGRTVSFLRPLATLQSRPGQFDRKLRAWRRS